jgi:hypothetical protein
MSALEPTWMRPGWLPEFEVIEWPGLQEMREEHVRLIAEDHAAIGGLGSLQAKFAAEDEQALAAEREAVKARKPSPEPPSGLTPALRRQAQLEVAEERPANARAALLAPVELIVRESLAWRGDGEAAIRAVGDQERDRAHTDDPKAWQGRTPEEANELGARSTAQRAQGITSDRAALERDCRTFETWFLTALGGDGENVRREVAETRGDQAAVVLAGIGAPR